MRREGDDAGISHTVVLFDSPVAFSEQIAPFVRGGVERDDVVIVTARPENSAPLRATIGEAAHAIRWHDASATALSPGQAFQRLHDTLLELGETMRGRILVVFEHVQDGRSAGEVRELLRYDALCNETLAAIGASMLCAFDTTVTDDTLLRQVRQAHPCLAENGQAVASSSYVGARDYLAAGDRFDDLAPMPSYSKVVCPPADAAARDVVAAFARGFLPPNRIDDLVFAANELVANAEEHGGGLLHLALWVDGATVVCEVADRGPGLLDPMSGYLPPPKPLDRGRGLWLVRQLCDLVELRTSEAGTRVRLHVSS